MEQSNGSQPKSITFRIHHGNKTKICIFEDEMSWQQIQQQLTQTFPSLDHVSDWHGEYDYGTWIEDTHDWSMITAHGLKTHMIGVSLCFIIEQMHPKRMCMNHLNYSL
eukprot:1131738_1